MLKASCYWWLLWCWFLECRRLEDELWKFDSLAKVSKPFIFLISWNKRGRTILSRLILTSSSWPSVTPYFDAVLNKTFLFEPIFAQVTAEPDTCSHQAPVCQSQVKTLMPRRKSHSLEHGVRHCNYGRILILWMSPQKPSQYPVLVLMSSSRTWVRPLKPHIHQCRSFK